MLKIIITIIFVYILIRLLVRVIFLVFGVFLTRALKAKYQTGARNGFKSYKAQDREDVIDAEFKEVKEK